MNGESQMIRTNSIIFKLTWQLSVIVGILFSVLAISNLYSLEVIQNNALTSSKNTLGLYKANIENSLDNYARDMIEVFDSTIEVALSMEHSDENGRYFQAMELKQALAMKMSSNESSELMYVGIPEQEVLITYFNNRISSKNKVLLMDALSSLELPQQKGWKDIVIGDVHYVYQSISYSGVTYGTLIQANSLFSIVNRGEHDPGQYVLSDLSGNIMAMYNMQLQLEALTNDALKEAYSQHYLLNSEVIPELGEMIHLVRKQNVFLGFQTMQWIIAILGMMSLIVVPLVLRALTRDVVKPILELVKAAKEVEKGQQALKLPNKRYSMEFMKLFHAFQSMVQEITALKIQSYEEELERNRIEIKYLQMQIRPHFYLNAISTITSLTYHHKNEEIRNLIYYLSKHLRYRFTEGVSEITLQEEIEHVQNYIQMQEIRYPDQIFYMADIDPQAGKVTLPQFMIQTLVENSFKHAMFYESVLSLFIRAVIIEHHGVLMVKITVDDNGEGFPQAWLQSYKNTPQGSNQEHVGIENIQRTLRLLYKRDDLLTCYNLEPTGARAELLIPLQTMNNNTEVE